MSETPLILSDKIDEANEITKTSMYYAMGLGIIPIPVFDFLAVTGVQLDLLRRLSKLYDSEFMESKGKNIIGALVGGSFSASLAPMLASGVKFIPFIGGALGALSMSVTAGASTYALGKVFIQHFESGGTFLTFDPKAVKDYYMEQLKEGTAIAKQAKPATSS